MPRIGRSFPPQWIEPNLGGPERALGPEPPQVVLPPTQQMPTVSVTLAATLMVNQRRNTQRRASSYYRGPILVSIPSPVLYPVSVSLATGILVRQRRAQQRRTTYFLGEPTALAVPLNQQQSTWNYGVNIASDLLRRRVMTRRFPLQGWTGVPSLLLRSSGAQTIVSPAGSQEGFGTTVQVSRDGTTLVVGTDAFDYGASHGAVYVYTKDANDVWTLRATLTAPAGGDDRWFGKTLAVSGDGATIAVGSQNNDAVYVFNGANWGTLAATLTAADAATGGDGTVFGWQIAMSDDAAVIAVGADLAYNTPDTSGQTTGAVYVCYGANWAAQVKRFPADNTITGYGYFVAISGDGAVVLVGTENTVNKVWVQSGAGWATQTILTPSDSPPDTASYGVGLAANNDGSTLVVAAPYYGGVVAFHGRGQLYVYTGSAWATETRLAPSAAVSTSCADLGTSLSISRDGRSIAALSDETDGSGALYLFSSTGGTSWETAGILRPPLAGLWATTDPGFYGQTVSLDGVGATAVLGSQLPGGSPLAESAFVFDLTKTGPFAPYDGTLPGFQRFLGPKPPLRVLITISEIAVVPATVAISRREDANRRQPHHFLTVPQLLAQPPPAAAISVTLASRRTRPSVIRSRLPLVIVAAAVFVAERVAVTIVRIRPRPTVRRLSAPATLTPYAVELLEETIRVVLAHARPRPTTRRLTAPTVLQVFAAPQTPLVRIRPRPTEKYVAPPATLEPEAVALAEREIRVVLIRIRPRPTRRILEPPTALQVFVAPAAPIVRIRPRRTISVLGPPVAVVEPEVAVAVVRISVVRARPRRTVSRYAGPVLVVAPSPILRKIATSLVRTRPRRTISSLPVVIPPTAAPVETVVSVSLVRTRPRRMVLILGPPLVIFGPPLPTQQQQTIAVTLVHTRPRLTATALRQPTVIGLAAAFRAASTPLVKTRPRRTVALLARPATLEPESIALAEREIGISLVRARSKAKSRLFPPATLEPFVVELREETVRVVFVHTRPRPTAKALFKPTVLQTFAGAAVTFARARPRPTSKFLAEPTVVRVPSVEEREETILVTLVRTRLRPTVRILRPPTVLAVFSGPEVAVARIRPRSTSKFIGEPTVLLVPSIQEQQRRIRITTVETRPRPTAKELSPPTVVISNPPVVTTIFAVADPVRDRRAWPRRFPLQGWRQRPIRETGAAAGIGLQGFDPLLGPRPPQIVGPLPIQAQQTIATKLVEPGNRRGWNRRYPLPGFEGQLVRQTGAGVTVIWALRKPNLGPKPPVIIGPLPTQGQQTVTVRLVAVRTRVEEVRHLARFNLAGPTVVAQAAFFGPEVTLVRARPRPTARNLGEPVVYPQTGEIAVTVVRTRPRPTTRRLTAVVYAATGEIGAALGGRTRLEAQRRAPRSKLRPPTVLRVPSVEQAEDTIRVVLVRARPRPTRKALAPPTALRVPAIEQRRRTVEVTLVRARPRPTRRVLAPPVAVEVVVYRTGRPALVRARPPKTTSFLKPPTIVFEERPPERFEIAVEITRVSLIRRGPFSRLFPPAVIAPTPLPTVDQRTIRVALVKTRPRPTRHRLTPPATLRPPPPPIPLWTDGEVVVGAETDGEIVETGASDGLLEPGAVTSGQVVPVTESTGETATTADAAGQDERTGLT
jgi:hypothetical protein